MKIFYALSLIGIFTSCQSQNAKTQKTDLMNNMSFYDFSMAALTGDSSIDFSQFKGKKVLVVNVASKCGYTPQYEGLQKLYEKYQDKLVIIGVPCNQFMFQEPGGAEEIATFCSVNYGVTFPLTEKVDVKGSNQHPLYTWLTTSDLNKKGDYKVSWNFNKFLIDENGNFVNHFDSKVKPFDKELIDAIEG